MEVLLLTSFGILLAEKTLQTYRQEVLLLGQILAMDLRGKKAHLTCSALAKKGR